MHSLNLLPDNLMILFFYKGSTLIYYIFAINNENLDFFLSFYLIKFYLYLDLKSVIFPRWSNDS
jgi:hypothetical protein